MFQMEICITIILIFIGVIFNVIVAVVITILFSIAIIPIITLVIDAMIISSSSGSRFLPPQIKKRTILLSPSYGTSSSKTHTNGGTTDPRSSSSSIPHNRNFYVFDLLHFPIFQVNKKSGRFKHKDNGQILEVNESTPGWVFSKLDSLTSSSSNSCKQLLAGYFHNGFQCNFCIFQLLKRHLGSFQRRQ